MILEFHIFLFFFFFVKSPYSYHDANKKPGLNAI